MNKKRPLHGKKTEKSDNFLGRVSIKTIVLSVVALIQMMLLITGTTFSWVETISSLALTGGDEIDNPVMTVANIGSGSGYDKALDLDAYFKKAGNVHLSTCSSADGQNFYFPIVGDNNNYRQSTVANKLRLLKLPDYVKEAVSRGQLSERHARALLKVPSERLEEVFNTIVTREYNVAKTEEYIKELLETNKHSLGISGNVQIGINTVNKAYEMVKKSGIDADYQMTEYGDNVKIVIRFKK